MTCQDCNYLLPAYEEGDLSPEDSKAVEAHLLSCALCRQALADLTVAKGLLKSLDEVEAPPFFEQRIMARIREEARGKEGLWKKLFYPLHIKIPIQAMASVLIAVFAFYIYQSGDPEIRQMAPLPAPLPELTQNMEKRPASRSSDSSVAEVQLPPKTPAIRQKDRLHKDALSDAAPGTDKGSKPDADVFAQRRAIGSKEQRDVLESIAVPLKGTGNATAPSDAARLNMAKEGLAEARGSAMSESHPPEQKKKTSMVESMRSMRTTPAPSVLKPAPDFVARDAALDLTIRVQDKDVTREKIETLLSRMNARMVESRESDNQVFLRAQIAALKIPDLLEGLKDMGLVKPDRNHDAFSESMVIITIIIIPHS
jgi:hypothetical protein